MPGKVFKDSVTPYCDAPCNPDPRDRRVGPCWCELTEASELAEWSERDLWLRLGACLVVGVVGGVSAAVIMMMGAP
jgi:hypothetical protein